MSNNINYSLVFKQTSFDCPKGWEEMKGSKKPTDELYFNYLGLGSKPVKREDITEEMIEKELSWAESFIY